MSTDINIVKLKREQEKLAQKIVHSKVTLHSGVKIAGVECTEQANQLTATVIVCEYPSFKITEQASYILHNPIRYHPEFVGYREIPAILEVINKLTQDPELIIIKGTGQNHPRQCGIATYLGLTLHIPTIGISEKNQTGVEEQNKIILNQKTVAIKIQTRNHSLPIYAAVGNLIDTESIQEIIPKLTLYPHKLPEPLHLAHKYAKKNSGRQTKVIIK